MPPPRAVPPESVALADVWADVRRVADLLGVPERGVQLITRLRARVDAVAQRVTQQQRRTGVACLTGLDPPVAAGGWISELVGLAGGEDVLAAPGAWPRALKREELEQAGPAILILAPAGSDLPCALEAARRLVTGKGWGALPAVRDGQVFVADGTACFGRPGPHAAETLEVVAEILHPAAFRFGHEGRLWARLAAAAGR
jgi:iron complex transport system substrate-binding protein